MTPAWLDALNNEPTRCGYNCRSGYLALVETLAEALERMHNCYLHDPQCLACAALAAYREGPK